LHYHCLYPDTERLQPAGHIELLDSTAWLLVTNLGRLPKGGETNKRFAVAPTIASPMVQEKTVAPISLEYRRSAKAG
jgi:hypothetical protein